MRKLIRLATALVLAAFFAADAYAAPQLPPAPTSGPVADYADVLTPAQEAALNQKLLTEIETLPNHPQVAVLIVKDTGGEDPAEYARRVARAWGVGQKGADNGVLIMIATHPESPDAFAWRIEVGRGLEGDLPDIKAKAIYDETMHPYFVTPGKEDYATALTGGIEAIRLILSGGKTGNEKIDNPSTGGNMLGLIPVGLFVLFFLAGIASIHWIIGTVLGGGIGAAIGASFALALPWFALPVGVGLVLGFVLHLIARATLSSGGGDLYGGSFGRVDWSGVGTVLSSFRGFGGGGFGGGGAGGGR